GSPTMNFLPVKVGGGEAVLGSGERVPVAAAYSGEAELGVRPENVAIAAVEEPAPIAARVVMVEELGEARIIHAELADRTPIALRQGEDAPAPARGEAIRLRLDPGR